MIKKGNKNLVSKENFLFKLHENHGISLFLVGALAVFCGFVVITQGKQPKKSKEQTVTQDRQETEVVIMEGDETKVRDMETHLRRQLRMKLQEELI